jgi:hypothetical protein
MQLGLIGAITFLVLGIMLIEPLLFSIPPFETLYVASMLCDGICGAVGYALGFLIGRLIEGPPKNK